MPNDIMPITNAEVVLYQPDENIQLDVRISNDTVWLTRQQMATLFGRDVKTIGKHINNALREELAVSVVAKNAITAPASPTVAKFAIVQFEGNRQVERNVEHYSLDMILSVGYRVHSPQGILFRTWANNVLKQYLLQGYSINHQLIALQERVDSRFTTIEQTLQQHEQQINFFVRTNQPPHEGVVFEGHLLEGRQGPRIQSFQADHESEYGTARHIDVRKYRTDFHDRFLIIDEDVYHFGASLKDLGTRLFAFDKMGLSKALILSQV